MIINDVVIPFHVKDTPILKYTCDSLKNILNVKNVYIIGGKNPNIPNTNFINENDIPNLIKLDKIKEIWNIKNFNLAHRSGWLYQQFLKLAAPEYINDLDTNFLICDADIVFLNNPYIYCKANTFPYAKSYKNEYHKPYRNQYTILLNENSKINYSFINHQMIFNKKYLKLLKNKIETINKNRWDVSILNTLDYNENSNFSEYDMYGNWMISNYGDVCEEILLSVIEYTTIPTDDDIKNCKSQNIHILSSQEWLRR